MADDQKPSAAEIAAGIKDFEDALAWAQGPEGRTFAEMAVDEGGEGWAGSFGPAKPEGPLTLTGYQDRAAKTAIYPGQGSWVGLAYAALGLAGEAGEIANKIKKVLRDDGGKLTPEAKAKLIDEVGDAQWYQAALASELGVTLGLIGKMNLNKLAGRAERGTIQGEGDDR